MKSCKQKQRASRHFRYSISLLMCIFLFGEVSLSQTVTRTHTIWRGRNYASFTSLCYHNDYFYCAFRDGKSHYDANGEDCGIIRILRSKKGRTWHRFKTIKSAGHDLRDPQLSVTPAGELMLLAESVVYEQGKAVFRKSHATLISNKKERTNLLPISYTPTLDWNWLWNIEWIDSVAYGFTYIPFFALVKSTDGLNYEVVQKFDLEYTPTEASIIANNHDSFFAIARSEKNAYIGIGNRNNGNWSWHISDYDIGCPKIIKINDTIYVIGRNVIPEPHTTLFKYNTEKHDVEPIVEISGSCDCSYPGIVYRNGYLFISHYKGNWNNSNILLTKIKLP